MLTDRFPVPNAEYLAPPPDAHQINHDPFYIIHGSEKKAIRKIFYTVPFTEYEEHGIAELERTLKEHPDIVLPEGWTRVDSLKFCYAGKFNMKKTLTLLKKHIEWKNNEAMHTLSTVSESFLKEGVVYQYGRDQKYRPIVVINIGKINFKKLNVDELICALSCCLTLVRKYFFIQGKVEQWIIIIDINNMSITKLPFKVLGKIIESMQINFTCTLEKLFIINPSFSLHTSWKIIEAMIDADTAAKIRFLKKGHYNEIFQLVDKNQVEEKYGGEVPELTEHWPPINTFPKEKYMKKYNSATLNDTKSNLFPIPENDGLLSSKSMKQDNNEFFVEPSPVEKEPELQANKEIVESSNVALIERTPEKNNSLVVNEEEKKEVVKQENEDIPCISRTPIKNENSENIIVEKSVEASPKEEQSQFDPSRLPTRKEIVLEAEEPRSKATGGCSCGSGSCMIF